MDVYNHSFVEMLLIDAEASLHDAISGLVEHDYILE